MHFISSTNKPNIVIGLVPHAINLLFFLLLFDIAGYLYNQLRAVGRGMDTKEYLT